MNVLVTVLIEQNDLLQSNRVVSSASGLKAQLDDVKGQIDSLENQIVAIDQTIREQKQEELTIQIATIETEISNLQREVMNLAAVMAQTGQHVLVMDADLRRPTLHDYFGVSNHLGLTTVLIGQATLENAIQSGTNENMSFLPSGPIPPNPTELLRSEKMSRTLAQLSEMVDVILIDSPPIIVADASRRVQDFG